MKVGLVDFILLHFSFVLAYPGAAVIKKQCKFCGKFKCKDWCKKSIKIGTKILFNKMLFEFSKTFSFAKVSGKNVSKSERFLTTFYKLKISSKK